MLGDRGRRLRDHGYREMAQLDAAAQGEKT
jgi:hypothetical protein